MPEVVFYGHGEEVLRVALEHRRLVLGRASTVTSSFPIPR